MRLKTAPRGGDRGCGRWIPTRAKVSLVLVSRGDEGPLNSVSTQPPLLAHRISLSPHVIGSLTPTQPPGLARLDLD